MKKPDLEFASRLDPEIAFLISRGALSGKVFVNTTLRAANTPMRLEGKGWVAWWGHMSYDSAGKRPETAHYVWETKTKEPIKEHAPVMADMTTRAVLAALSRQAYPRRGKSVELTRKAIHEAAPVEFDWDIRRGVLIITAQ